jgi:hypothetical protein
MKLPIAFLSALASVAMFSMPATAQDATQVPSTTAPVQQWEYLYADARLAVKQKIIGSKSTWVLSFEGKEMPLKQGMAELGMQGWELAVAYVEDNTILSTTYVFKRRIK